MSVSFVQVQDGIAALAIVGLKRIYTSADVPVEMFSRLCPALIPDPDTPILESQSDVITISGRGWSRTRTLAYVCLTEEVGAARGAYMHGARLAQVWDGIENALCDFEMAGIHRVSPVRLEGNFPVNDHSGKQFFGFKVRISYLTSY